MGPRPETTPPAATPAGGVPQWKAAGPGAVNLEFILDSGVSRMVYDVHPASQDTAVPVPDGAVSVVVWLGTALR